MARRALLLANGSFADAGIGTLKSPVADGQRLAALLRRTEVGGFDVSVCADADSSKARREVQRFFDAARDGDMHFILISGHGLKDRRGKLHFATADTQLDALKATSLAASYVIELMDESAASQQILFLDTCYSGAFQSGTISTKGLQTVSREDFGGDDAATGKAIVTATTGVQLASEAEQAGIVQSVFTRHLIEGIETGAADSDASGRITLTELFHYVRDGLKRDAPGQTPQPYYYGLEGSVVVALNPVPKPAVLPDELRTRIASSDRVVRGAAVEDLLAIALSPAREAVPARIALSGLERDDSLFVRRMARDALDELPGAEDVAPPVQGPDVVAPPVVESAAADANAATRIFFATSPSQEADDVKPVHRYDGWVQLPDGDATGAKTLTGGILAQLRSWKGAVVGLALAGAAVYAMLPSDSSTTYDMAADAMEAVPANDSMAADTTTVANAVTTDAPVDPPTVIVPTGEELHREGYAYYSGEGVIAKDYARAFNLVSQAAELGELAAQTTLGFFYENGIGVASNTGEALKWYRRAAQRGSSIAQQNLGLMFATGTGVTTDFAQAFQWFQRSARQGNADGLYSLARAYALGEGVSPDLARAAELYRQSAEKNDPLAQYEYGLALEDGLGVEKDPAAARKWYRRVLANPAAEADTKKLASERLAAKSGMSKD